MLQDWYSVSQGNCAWIPVAVHFFFHDALIGSLLLLLLLLLLVEHSNGHSGSLHDDRHGGLVVKASAS